MYGKNLYRNSFVLAVVLLFAACAATPLQRAAKMGYMAKQTAEATYTAVYREYKNGNVPEAQMQQARDIYDKYYAAQTIYVNTLKLIEQGMAEDADLEVVQQSIADLVRQLIQLAQDLEVL